MSKTAEAIERLRQCWLDRINLLSAQNQKLDQAEWNRICDVLGFADRFKL